MGAQFINVLVKLPINMFNDVFIISVQTGKTMSDLIRGVLLRNLHRPRRAANDNEAL